MLGTKGRSEHAEIRVKLEFEKFHKKFTCDGEGISPLISINGLSSPYMAIIMDDPDAPGGTFVHWVVWNIPSMEQIPKQVSTVERPPELSGAMQGINSGRETGYMGPCPPRGKPHRYFVKVYGLDSPLELSPSSGKKELENAMNGRIKEYGEAMATYQR